MRTSKRGVVLAPKMCINDHKTRSFIMSGRSCSGHATNKETQKRASGTEVVLNVVPVAMRNAGQKIFAFSATEAVNSTHSRNIRDVTCDESN